MNLPVESVDITIIGGGMVGSSLALALSQLPIKIALVEPFAPIDEQAPGFDVRAIALSRASARILNSLNLWSDIRPQATPIEHIHVSDKGRPGICRFSAAEINIPAMGYVVSLQQVGVVMHKALSEANLQLFCPGQLEAIKPLQADGQLLTVNHQGQTLQLQSRLVIAADGGQSPVREMLGLTPTVKPYQQGAIVSTIQTQLDHGNRAFERFTDQGPVAFLPLPDKRISLVWMLPPETAQQLKDSSDEDFISQLQDAFGYRLGKITRVGERHYYPLNLVETNSEQAGILFIGNAAQSLHPIAGQGFNLGLRDVADLVDVIRQACQQGVDLADPTIQSQYLAQRQPDRQHIITMTDALARLFANPSRLLSVPRNGLLSLMSFFPGLRHEFSRFAMGLYQPASRLTRGLPIDPGARP